MSGATMNWDYVIWAYGIFLGGVGAYLFFLKRGLSASQKALDAYLEKQQSTQKEAA